MRFGFPASSRVALMAFRWPSRWGLICTWFRVSSISFCESGTFSNLIEWKANERSVSFSGLGNILIITCIVKDRCENSKIGVNLVPAILGLTKTKETKETKKTSRPGFGAPPLLVSS